MSKIDGVSLGQVATNDKGRVYISQKVMGTDVKDIADACAAVKKAHIKPIEDSIAKSAKKTAALQEAQNKLMAMQLSTQVLANRVNVSKDNIMPSAFNLKNINLSTNDQSPSANLARVNVTNDAKLGTFTLSVSQLATGDLIKSTIATNYLSAPINLAGTLNLGTTIPGSSQPIVIDRTMSLSSIQSAINALSSQTGVSADIAQISPGQYEFKLKAAQTGASICLTDGGSGIITSLSLTRPASNTLATSIQATDHITPLNITSTLNVGTSSGNAQTINITNTMSITDICAAINATTGLSGVTADFDQTYSGPNVYQIRLKTTNPSATVYTANTSGTSLGFNTPVTDYNNLAAKITCDGTNYKRNTNAISDVLSGVTLNLQGTSNNTVLTGSIVQDSATTVEIINSFMEAYNDFNIFYKEQNKMAPDGKGPAETAFLFQNKALKSSFDSIKNTLRSSVDGASAAYNRLDFVGMGFDGAGNLIIKNKMIFDSFTHNNFTGLETLFGNVSTSKNTTFRVGALPTTLPKDVANTPLSLTYARDANGLESATFTLNGQTYPATVKNGQITGPVNTILGGIEIIYDGGLTNGQSQSTTLNITQGLAARVDNIITDNLVDDPQANKFGAYATELNTITQKNKKSEARIADLEKQAAAESKKITKDYEKVYAATAQLESINMMLKSFNKANKN